MAKKKKKTAKKPAAKKTAKKPGKKLVKKSVKKAAKKGAKKTVKRVAKRVAPNRKAVQKKAAPTMTAAEKQLLARMSEPGFLSVHVAAALEDRLIDLAMRMAKPLDQVLAQALAEFAETWEDHMSTVNTLNQDDDRMQLVAPPEPIAEPAPESVKE